MHEYGRYSTGVRVSEPSRRYVRVYRVSEYVVRHVGRVQTELNFSTGIARATRYCTDNSPRRAHCTAARAPYFKAHARVALPRARRYTYALKHVSNYIHLTSNVVHRIV